MSPFPPHRNNLSTRQFAWIFGGLLALLTIYQLAQHRPQRFEPPPSGTTAEIPAATPVQQPAPMPNALPEQPTGRDARIYTYVEQMPQPPGGMDGLMQYLAKNLKLPAEALRNEATGKVFVRFIVRPDGHLEEFEVVKGLSPALDEAAVRVLRQMPPWMPGKQNGRPVSVYYTVPVNINIK